MTTPATAALPRPRDVSGEFGVYVHVPFCTHRCWYCDFNTYAGLDHLQERYMSTLEADARLWTEVVAGAPTVTSIFVGGGTPSRVPARSLVAVLDAIRGAWDMAPDAEVTVECNPEDAEAEKLRTLREAGVNRLSFGVQALQDRLLSSLGRVHDAGTAIRALEVARDAGFERLNADLIFGVPGEDDDDWHESLEGVLACGVTHVSAYGLTYEEGTPLHAWRRLGKVTPVGEDDAARRWEIAGDLLGSAGFERYEISNWARPGHASRHNRLYWACGEYVGLGAGAHSHLARPEGSIRSWTVKAPERYMRAVRSGADAEAGRELLDAAGRAAEVMFLGLRRLEGVEPSTFRALTGRELEAVFGDRLEVLAGRGLLVADEHGVRLTERGTLLANEVLSAFL